MKFSFFIKSIKKDFKRSSKISSIISLILIILIIISMNYKTLVFVPGSNDFKSAGLTVVSILFSFQLFLFQSTDFDNIKTALNDDGLKQLNRYRATLVTNFRIMLLYMFCAIIFFENNYIENSILFILSFKLIWVMMYSTILFNISVLKETKKIPHYHINKIKNNDCDEDEKG